jgi:S1-C subfamily serine protease
MVPSNILQRTFHIAHNGEAGTAFTIEVADRQYIVTAAHVVKGLQPNSKLSVMHGGQWLPVDIGDVWFSPTGADIALISPRKQLSPAHPVVVGSASSFYLSQQIYFLGFPYGLRADLGTVNNDYPMPFVKTGIVSSFTSAGAGSQIIFCDGHNNPGFSGGPIVTVGKNHQVHVIAVVSGYRYNDDPVLLNGEKTGLTYRANTGLVIGYGLKELVERATSAASGAAITVRA